MTTPPLPEQIELHRDRRWRRDEDLRVEGAPDAERFIEDVGFANTLTDPRRAGPSLYIAVCGRRDVSLARSIQKRGRRTKRTANRRPDPIGSPSLRRPLRPSAVKRDPKNQPQRTQRVSQRAQRKTYPTGVIQKYDSPRIWQNHPKG